MPGCQPLKSPTTLHPAAASSAANANVTLTLSALRKSLIMPVSLCRGERQHCAGQAPARSPRRAATATTNRSREGGGVPTALPAARRLNNDDVPDRRPRRPTARTTIRRHHAPGATQVRVLVRHVAVHPTRIVDHPGVLMTTSIGRPGTSHALRRRDD